jgi:hypothetical protein
MSPEEKKAAREREQRVRRITGLLKEDEVAAMARRAAMTKRKLDLLDENDNFPVQCFAVPDPPGLGDAWEDVDDETVDEDEAAARTAVNEELRRKFLGWKSDGAYFQKLCRYDPAGFDALFALAKDRLAETTLRGAVRANRTYRTHMLDDELQFFITLHWLKFYPTYEQLRMTFGLHERHLAKYLFRVLKALSHVLKDEVKLPSDEELIEMKEKQAQRGPESMKNVLFAIDGTELKIRAPVKKEYQRSHYSVKKKQYALNLLLLVTLDGRIAWSSGVNSKLQDQSIWNDSKIRSYFEERVGVGLVGDSGFTFNLKTKPNDPLISGLTPHKRPRKNAKSDAASPSPSKLTDEQKKFNTELSRTRVVVENVNARLKKWKIMRGPIRHFRHGKPSLISPELIVDVVVGLTARELKTSPCRAADWTPKPVTQEDLDDNNNQESDDEEQ